MAPRPRPPDPSRRLAPSRVIPRLSPWLVALTLLLIACTDDDAAAPRQGGTPPVEMHVRWEIDETFPATITIHEPPPEQALYEVHTYLPGETAVVGEELPGGVLRAEYSEPRRFIAQLRNDSDEDVRFWVAPHLPFPHVTDQGLMMFCLCTGQVYEVPAGGTWTRVMEFGVTRRAAIEGPIALIHVIVRGEITAPEPVAGRAPTAAPR